MVDATGRKQAELEARQTRDELAHAGRLATMGEMAAALAHEINQPLAAILTNAQAANRFLSAPSPDLNELHEILRDIVADDVRAGEVIRRIRSLVNKDPSDNRPLDLNAVVKEVVSLLHSDAVIRGVVILQDLAPNLPRILGDRIQLQQVLLNLLLNAFDAMRDSLPRDRVVKLRSRRVDSAVLVTISDQGPGIPPQDIERLFEPFRSTKPGGLGMGLSISRSIVASHGGRLWAENNATRGATFGFSLPVPVEIDAQYRSSQHERGAHTVFVVDDDASVRKSLVRLSEVDGISSESLRLGLGVPGRLAARARAGLPGARCPDARAEWTGVAGEAPRT